MKNKIKIHNLSKDKKENLKEGILLTTGLAGSIGIFAAFGSGLFSEKEIENIEALDNEELVSSEDNQIESVEDILVENSNFEDDEYIEVETSMEVADLSEFTFSEAFKGARAEYGPGGLFEYNGQTYTTYYKEEVDAMNTEEVLAYSNQIESTMDPSTITFHERTTNRDEILEIEEVEATESFTDDGEDTETIEENLVQDTYIQEDNSVDEIESQDTIPSTEDSNQSGDNSEVFEIETNIEEVIESMDTESPNPIDLSDFEDEAFHGNIELPESSSTGNAISNESIDPEIYNFQDEEFGTQITESSQYNNANVNFAEVDFNDFEDEEFGDTSDLAVSSQGVEQVVYFADADLSEFNDPAFDEILEISDTTTEADRTLLANEAVDLKDFEDVAFGDGIQETDSSFSDFDGGDVIVDANDFNDPLFSDNESSSIVAQEEVIDVDDSTLAAVIEPTEIIEIDPDELEYEQETAETHIQSTSDQVEVESSDTPLDDFDDDLFDPNF